MYDKCTIINACVINNLISFIEGVKIGWFIKMI